MGTNLQIQDSDSFNNSEPGKSPENPPVAADGGWDNEFFIRAALRENHQLGTELLFNQYYAVLCKHAMRFVGSREIAEDLVGDISP